MKCKFLSTTGLVALLCMGCGSSNTATTSDLFQVNPTSVSLERMTGAKPPSQAEQAEYLKVPDVELVDGVTTPITLPTQVDLSRLAPSPSNQRALGSCAAFAYGYGLGTATSANTTRDVNLAGNQVSPAYIYKQALTEENNTELPTNHGVYAASVLTALVRDGSASYANVPYPDTFDVLAAARYIFDLPLNQSSQQFAIGGWGSFSSTGTELLEDIKERLASDQLVGFETDLYPGIETWTGSEVFRSDDVPIEGAYHAMLIVGYDDNRQAMRVQNSWSSNWGDGGRFWLAYDLFLRTDHKHVFLANPRETVAPPVESTGSLLSSVGGPTGQITSVIQDTSDDDLAMVLRYRFEDAVTVTNVTVGDADQAMSVLVRNGNFYWVRSDGHSYPTGPQSVTVLARDRDGQELTYTGTVDVPALAGFTPAPSPVDEIGTNGQNTP